MVLELVSRDELGRCLGIEAGEGPLPVTARTLTETEMRARNARALIWPSLVYLLFGAVALAVLELAETSPRIVQWLPAAFAVGGVALLIYAFLKLRPGLHYRDPGLAVEVAEDRVTISGVEGEAAHLYRDLIVSRIITRTPRNSVYFDGIELSTSLGKIALGNPAFVGGTAAAGAILRRLDELELPLTRAA